LKPLFIFRFGVFEADLRSGELRKRGAQIKLQYQPFQILVALLNRPGELVTREELRQQLWPADTFVDFDHSLNAAVKRLRDALGESAGAPVFIETLARRGYRFIAPVNGSSATSEIAIAPALVPIGAPQPCSH
jgi:DNA-binding winged helix-turn-helix (wHTH) protein